MLRKFAIILTLVMALVSPCMMVKNVEAAATSRLDSDPAGAFTVVQPRWTYIGTIVTSMDISNLGKATCATTVGTTSTSYLCKIHAELLQRMPGYYKVVDSWDVSDYGAATLSKATYVYSGYTYVLESKCSIWNKSGTTKLEEETVTYEKVYN